MKNGAGRRSSPFGGIGPERWNGQLTDKPLEIPWVLEAATAEFPAFGRLLDGILAGNLFPAGEIPSPEAKPWRAIPASSSKNRARDESGPPFRASGEGMQSGPLSASGPAPSGTAPG